MMCTLQTTRGLAWDWFACDNKIEFIATNCLASGFHHPELNHAVNATWNMYPYVQVVGPLNHTV